MNNLINQRFGRLFILERVDRPAHVKNKNVWWGCRCDCGNIVLVEGTKLKDPNGTRSCGCLRREHCIKLGETSRKPYGESSRNNLILQYIRGAVERGLEYLLTVEQAETLFQGNCFYCGVEPKQIIWELYS